MCNIAQSTERYSIPPGMDVREALSGIKGYNLERGFFDLGCGAAKVDLSNPNVLILKIAYDGSKAQLDGAFKPIKKELSRLLSSNSGLA